MQAIRNNSGILGGAVTLLYALVIFFAQNFHDHGSGVFFKEMGIKSHGKTMVSSGGKLDDSGCFSCHLLYDGHAPQLASNIFNFDAYRLFQREIFAYGQRFSMLTARVHHLRGPPAV